MLLLTKFDTAAIGGPCFGFIEIRVTRFGKESVTQNATRALKGWVIFTVGMTAILKTVSNKVQFSIETIIADVTAAYVTFLLHYRISMSTFPVSTNVKVNGVTSSHS
jgi:hypothetical protein